MMEEKINWLPVSDLVGLWDRQSPSAQSLPGCPGTYVLVMQLDRDRQISPGRLGRLHFPKGYYIYIGSAFGPGGLRARLKHHLRPATRPRWHVDYLRKFADLVFIGASLEDFKWEHHWAEALAGRPDLCAGIDGFGCSDCNCRAHLFRVLKASLLRELFGAGPTFGCR